MHILSLVLLHTIMRFICMSIVTFAVLAGAENPKDKRLAVDPNTGYHQQQTYSQQSTQPEYLATQNQPQQYYQSETPQTQAISYSQPQTKYSSAAATPIQKYSFLSQQPKKQIQYSSAADVSSFSYNSPIVSYSNLGLLKQIAGQAASARDVPVNYNSEQPAKTDSSSQPKVQYISSPKVQFSPSPVQYSSPKLQYTSPVKSQYTASPSAMFTANAAPNYEEIYQQLAQKAALTTSQQSAQLQQYTYQPAAPQRVTYQKSPAPVVYQYQKSASAADNQEKAYAQAPAQQYTYQLPQEYESGAQSSPQVFYSQGSQGSQTQAQAPQYYTLDSQGQAKGGVTYSS
ncbi:uncharacterized protein LOC130903811 [Diorhabda carinulata]|uniref:uncharacterized protein LOC130903811 n=1 Tax=Diorhabda carinulata TaxID=1163345 RepID=UPI0025A1DD97|nr:uncharacterized protein LOC130903811 [Diorhabda carinulata]